MWQINPRKPVERFWLRMAQNGFFSEKLQADHRKQVTTRPPRHYRTTPLLWARGMGEQTIRGDTATSSYSVEAGEQ